MQSLLKEKDISYYGKYADQKLMPYLVHQYLQKNNQGLDSIPAPVPFGILKVESNRQSDLFILGVS